MGFFGRLTHSTTLRLVEGIQPYAFRISGDELPPLLITNHVIAATKNLL